MWTFSGNTTVDELMMRLMGAMEIFTAQQLEDIKDEVRFVCLTFALSGHILRLHMVLFIVSEYNHDH